MVESPQALRHGETVGLGQHDVQDDDVVNARRSVIDARLAVVDQIDPIAVVFQNAAERLGEADVVFYYQNAHGGPLGSRKADVCCEFHCSGAAESSLKKSAASGTFQDIPVGLPSL